MREEGKAEQYLMIESQDLPISFKEPVSGFVLCQCWTAEFKGITWPVLFMIFFYDFVTPKKRNMSEGCWLFTLEMAVQSLGTTTSLSGDFRQM